MSEITIKINEKPNMPKCEMNCDDMLDKKLEKYELTKFFNTHTTNLFIGKPKSGKSSLLYSLFKGTFKHIWDKIYYFSPELSRASMVDNIFESLPESQKYSEMTYDNLEEVANNIKRDAQDGLNSCIIYDDQGAYLKQRETLNLFKELCMNKRHYHLTQFFLVQTWYSVVKDVRRLFDNIIVFRVSKNELSNIFDEVVEQRKDLVIPISKIVFDKPFEYLVINTASQRLFKGFDELIINDA
jgi:hypothetical protein